MTRLLFPICAALLSTLAGLHLSTHLRQEEQRLARWGEIPILERCKPSALKKMVLSVARRRSAGGLPK